MQGTQKWYESTTIQHGIVAFISMLAQVFNLDLDEGIITELVISLIGVYGIGMTIYGRIKAKYLITK